MTATDVDGDPLTYSVASGPGTMAGNLYSYSPPWDEDHIDETDTVTIQVSDGHGGTDAKSFQPTVHDVNRPPSLDEILSQEVDEGSSLSLTVSASDPDGDPLSYSVIDGPGSMTGSTYEYPADWDTDHVDESYTVTIQVDDGYGGMDTKSFQLTVHDVNRPPTADPQSMITDEDLPLNITLTGSDPDGDPLTFSIISGTSHGSLSGTPPDVTYNPDSNYNGADGFTFQVDDGYGGTATATVSITVNPVNDPPVAVDDSATTDEDTPVMVDVLANDSDIDGDALTIASVGDPSHGTAAIVGNEIQYTPESGYSGSDSFTYTVSDGHGGTASATVSVVVNAVNHPPVAVDDYATTDEDTPVTIDVLANDSDPDGDTLTITSVSTPWHGTATIIDNKIYYNPDTGYSGTDSFSYEISDGHGGTASATVTVEVEHVNHPPVAYDSSYTADCFGTEDKHILLQATDPDGDLLTYIIVSEPQEGILMPGSSPGEFYYHAKVSACCDCYDHFTFKVNDGELDSNIATVTIWLDPPE